MENGVFSIIFVENKGCKMADKKIRLIINPISGTGKKRGLAEMVTGKMAPLGYDVETVLTAGPADATRLASEAIEQGFHSVLVAGGDGTINETATALCGSNVALGIIPAGSGNGLARHLNIPIDAAHALDIIAENNIIDCDYCTVNDRPFFCTFGMGFDATVSERFAHQQRRGKLMYVKSAIEELFKYAPQRYTITANGETWEEDAFIIACCNASQYGSNAYIAPHASVTDGLIDVTVIHKENFLRTAKMGIDLFSGYIDKNTRIHTFRAPEVVISRQGDGPAHIDGEPLIMSNNLTVKCHPAALKLFVPTEDKPFRPIATPAESMWTGLKITLENLFSTHK